MLGFALCFMAMWRVVMMAAVMTTVFILCGMGLEHVVVNVSSRSALAMEELPTVLWSVRTYFWNLEAMILFLTFGSVCNAYRVYRILYPKFVRGGRDAIQFYWWQTSHHGGCPAAGFKVAVILAALHEKR